jgi:hypothetical protein
MTTWSGWFRENLVTEVTVLPYPTFGGILPAAGISGIA